MELSRRGHDHNRGQYTITLSSTEFSWDRRAQKLKIGCRQVRDFDTEAYHDYQIAVPLHEIRAMITTLAESGIAESPEELEPALAPILKSLARLTAVAAGIGLQLPQVDRETS